MKKYKTYSTNPELCVVGAKCHVSMPSRWIGAYEAAEKGENVVWIPAKITEIRPSKQGHECPVVCVYLRASQKYHTGNLENLMILPSQVENCIRFR